MSKGGWKIAVVILIAIAGIILSIGPLQTETQLGLDLKGGAEVVLQAIPEEGKTVTPEDMSQLQEIMRKRVDEMGVSEPIIQISGEDRLIIQLAGVNDPDEAIERLGRTAKLEFRDPQGNVILSGSDLKNAQGVNSNGEIGISLEFSEEGTKKFADATARYVGQKISIYLDGELLTDPIVQVPITNGQASITGQFDLDYAVSTAALLRGGALPVDVEVMSKRTVGPSLGMDSLMKSFHAAIIGMILLVVFLIVYYRLPGVVAFISLIFYGLILIWLLNLIGVVLTLPGIAGFVLSIGMAVDANIIIYERLKEEIRNGKSIRSAIEAGFSRAMWSIIDANVTTLIAAAVLFKFGSGSIQGFAVTLAVGILVSMFTALFLTHYLLRWSTDIHAFGTRPQLYGGRGRA